MALTVGLSLLVSSVLVPVALKLPRWIEFEVVLLVWWGVLFAMLGALLHRGVRVRDDHSFRVEWAMPQFGPDPQEPRLTTTRWDWIDALDIGGVELEGCAGVLVGAVLAAASFAAAWFVVELAFPALFSLVYWLVLKAIARVANDRHACEGNALRSIAWGVVWATLYTLPMALVVWGMHVILAARPHG